MFWLWRLRDRQARLAYRQRMLDLRLGTVEDQIKIHQAMIDNAFRKIEEAARGPSVEPG